MSNSEFAEKVTNQIANKHCIVLLINIKYDCDSIQRMCVHLCILMMLFFLRRAHNGDFNGARGGWKKYLGCACSCAGGLFDKFTFIETNEGAQDPSGLLSGEGPASATFFGCQRRPKCRGTIGRG
jgi:hypothetical protein